MIDYNSPVQQPMPQQKVVKQVEQPVAHHPEDSFLSIPDWYWLGFILPIILGWIMHRKLRK